MNNIKRNLIQCMCLFTVISSLASCMDVAVTGAQAVYNRRTIQNSLNDNYITMRSNQVIYVETKRYKDTHVSIATFNNMVLLTGQTPKATEKDEIEQIVKKISKSKEIYNQITVAQPVPTLIRLSDTWITSKIKATLIATNEIDPSQIKVVTENGTVYLLGILPPKEAEIAVNVARTTAGVQNVVKVFSYVHISRI